MEGTVSKRFGRHPRKRLNYLEAEYERVTRELRELQGNVDKWNHGLQGGLARLATITPPEVQTKIRKMIRTTRAGRPSEHGRFLEAAAAQLYNVIDIEVVS
jgi:hypothetical protein